MKRIISTAASVAMLLSSVSPVAARRSIGGSEAINYDTGRRSINVAVEVEADVVLVRNANMSMGASTTTMSGANSGANTSSGNDDGAGITSQAATSGAMSDSLVNASDTYIEEPACDRCDRTAARNIETGRGSTNIAVAADVDVVAVSNANMAMCTSTTTMSGANSGANTASGNDDGASINAGPATSSASAVTTVNSNVTRVIR